MKEPLLSNLSPDEKVHYGLPLSLDDVEDMADDAHAEGYAAGERAGANEVYTGWRKDFERIEALCERTASHVGEINLVLSAQLQDAAMLLRRFLEA